MLIAIPCILPLEVSAKGKVVGAAQLKDASGEPVGRVIGTYHQSCPYILTDQGYRTNTPLPRGWIGLKEGGIAYETTDCTGTPYVSWVAYVGTVFTPNLPMDDAYELGMILYIPHSTQSVAIHVSSIYNTWADPLNPTCDLVEPPVYEAEMYPAYLNDPAITGIQNTVYSIPMVIE